MVLLASLLNPGVLETETNEQPGQGWRQGLLRSGFRGWLEDMSYTYSVWFSEYKNRFYFNSVFPLSIL